MADVTIGELKKDRDQLLQQALAVSGALQYINQKIAALEKLDEVVNDKEDKRASS